MALNVITSSHDKFAELKTVLGSLEQIEMDLPEIQELDAQKIVEAKLKEAINRVPGEYIVEDTSLYCEALGSLPGPLIKWFVKAIGNEGVYKMAQVFNNTRAQARSIIGYTNEVGVMEYFEGVVDGSIVPPRGTGGFGWDPIFLPAGTHNTLAEMAPEEKSRFSMRRIAAQKLKDYLLAKAAPPAAK